MKVFLDANILFSATNPRWLTRHLLDALEQSGVLLISSPYVWEEAERNVHNHFPKFLNEFKKLQKRVAITDDPSLAEGQLDFLPDKDRPVLAAASYSHCTHLLTGDFKHFGNLMGKTIHGVKVVNQRMIAEELTQHSG